MNVEAYAYKNTDGTIGLAIERRSGPRVEIEITFDFCDGEPVPFARWPKSESKRLQDELGCSDVEWSEISCYLCTVAEDYWRREHQ